MTSIVWNSKEFEGISPFKSQSDEILSYIRNFLKKKESSGDFAVLMPSLKTLMAFFNCSQSEVQDVLGLLKMDGYDFIIPGMYGHITLYKQTY